jgi:hypothetical protein
MSAGYIILALIVAGFLWVLGWFAFRYISFIKKSWRIKGLGRDFVVYEERKNGEIVFYAELMGRGPIKRVVYIPSEDDWNAKSPSWARDRRDEIIKRLKQVLPESRTEYKRSK